VHKAQLLEKRQDEAVFIWESAVAEAGDAKGGQETARRFRQRPRRAPLTRVPRAVVEVELLEAVEEL